ncbi:hypothetical protein [Pseudoroseomonas cervicalis]|uniref:hypothetical protein n=1 Tax=Teichococcus cervicalis TaxID=204525 RepID=UPI0027867A11|nr:hypothetical protein [Pseudoroseomonas cervicalis]MDQ1080770.1 hypothetical protein [Pseudoroseomonas cervicalis]
MPVTWAQLSATRASGRGGGGVQHQAGRTARLEAVPGHAFPARHRMAGDVGEAAFHPAPVFDEIRADQMDLGQLRATAIGEATPAHRPRSR